MKPLQVVLLSVVTAAVTSLAVIFAVPRSQPGTQATERVLVPGLHGLSEADAKINLEAVGLVLMVGGRTATMDAPPGSVLDQEPAAGAEVETGAVVRVTFALPPPIVPSVVGKPLADAKRELVGAGYTVEVGEAIESDEPAGTVVVQHPGAGTELAPEGKVSVSVSKALSRVKVPKLSGLPAAAAKAEAEKVGLRIEEKVVALPETPLGVVLRQTPAADENVSPGTSIEVVINR